jgi:hypothetical protein
VTSAVTAATVATQEQVSQLLAAIQQLSQTEQEGLIAVRTAIVTFSQANAARHSQLADQIAAARN